MRCGVLFVMPMIVKCERRFIYLNKLKTVINRAKQVEVLSEKVTEKREAESEMSHVFYMD